MKALAVALVGFFPSSPLKNYLLRRLGWDVAGSADISPSLYWRIGGVTIGENARIGIGNVFRDLRDLRLSHDSRIGQWNWISAATPLVRAGGAGDLLLEQHSALTSRHYLDCSGGIQIGSHATVAGVRSTFVTHGLQWTTSMQSFRGIKIGAYSLISSNCSLTPGTRIGRGVVIGMGATVAGNLSEPGLYLSNRANLVKSPLEGEYFTRTVGYIRDIAPPRSTDGL
ncbi:acyltransferase [Microbacterium sp. ARD31]|uniref:acyltransferase n=1 Tax=Microbacterium sp. ARD31 TaxID=2962576 RepID=UPI0037CA45BA